MASATRTRRQFLQTLGWMALARPALPLRAAAAAEVPSYLKGFEAQYADNPHAAGLAWHRQAKWGLFIHYALESLRGLTAAELLAAKAVSRDAWRQLREGAQVNYVHLRDRFTAERFDADFITDLAISAEMRYVNLTTRHRGGLYLFRTSTSDFTSVNSPARRDLVGELAEQCRRKGLGLFLYCPPDVARSEPAEAFARNCTAVRELLTQYGPVAGIWLDGINPFYAQPAAYDRLGELYSLIRSLQPQCLISFKEGTGAEDFVAPERSMHNPLRSPLAKRAEALNAGTWGDICTVMQMNPASWLYLDGCRHLDAGQVRSVLADAFYQGANLTLNTAPLPDGSIHPSDVIALREAGVRIRRDGWPDPKPMDPALARSLDPADGVG